MEQTVLLPLGMTDSTFRQDITEAIVKGYPIDRTPVPDGYNLMPEQAAAGLWITASDLAKFGIHLQNILRGKAGLIHGNGCCVPVNSDAAPLVQKI